MLRIEQFAIAATTSTPIDGALAMKVIENVDTYYQNGWVQLSLMLTQLGGAVLALLGLFGVIIPIVIGYNYRQVTSKLRKEIAVLVELQKNNVTMQFESLSNKLTDEFGRRDKLIQQDSAELPEMYAILTRTLFDTTKDPKFLALAFHSRLQAILRYLAIEEHNKVQKNVEGIIKCLLEMDKFSIQVFENSTATSDSSYYVILKMLEKIPNEYAGLLVVLNKAYEEAKVREPKKA